MCQLGLAGGSWISIPTPKGRGSGQSQGSRQEEVGHGLRRGERGRVSSCPRH